MLFKTLCVISSALLMLSGCTTFVDNRGYDFEIADTSKVQVGQTKDDVMRSLGTPSSLSTFQDNAWYYISRKTGYKSFFDPQLMEQHVLIVHFDNDRVTRIEQRGKDAAQQVELSKNTTQTSGYETGVMREVFGNFGNFSSGPAPTKS